MGPRPAPDVATINQRALIEAATRQIEAYHFTTEDVRIALGVISNLYCFYALENPKAGPVLVEGLVCAQFASKPQVLGEIRRALPRASGGRAERILSALSQALDGFFADKGCRWGRLMGFGVFEADGTARSIYLLRLELPLSEFLQTGYPRFSHQQGADD